MTSGGCSIVWFRRDLRVEDNPALAAGVRAGAVIAVFIWAPEEEGTYYPGRVSRWWLKHSLALLDSSLRKLGTSLITKRSVDSVSSLLEIVKSTGATQLFFNHLYGQFFFFLYLFLYLLFKLSYLFCLYAVVTCYDSHSYCSSTFCILIDPSFCFCFIIGYLIVVIMNLKLSFFFLL